MDQPVARVEAIVQHFLAAMEARDLDAVLACFSPDATWSNMPHPPAVGHDGLRALFGPIIARSEQIRWDVVAAAHVPGRAFLERVDRFWIDGQEHAASCNGVFEVDEASGLIVEVRDYVDLTPWRERLAGVW